jgi:hypothetical protein
MAWEGNTGKGRRRERRKGKGRREKEDAGREWRMRKAQPIQNEHGQERRTFIAASCGLGAREHICIGFDG